MSKLTDMIDKIKAKLHFGKKNNVESFDTTEAGNTPVIFTDKSYSFNPSSPELTVAPMSYYELVKSDEFEQAREEAATLVKSLNLGIQHAPIMDKIVELRATRIAVDGLMNHHLCALRLVYDTMLENQHQNDELKSYLDIRKKQLDEINATINALER